MKTRCHIFPALLAAPLLLLTACAGISGRLAADDPQTRSMALDEVLRSGEKGRRNAAMRMKKILAAGKPPYNLYAASALEDLGPSAAPAVPELIAALTGPDSAIAFTAARALSKLDAAVPALTEALGSGSPELRREAARILPAHGARTAAALVKNLAGPDTALAAESARVLGETGPAAKEAVPALAKAAYSGSAGLKEAALAALGKIGVPAGRWLAAAMNAPDPKIRAAAAQVLSGMTPPSPEAAIPLAAALDDTEQAVRVNAARALAAYPPETQALFPENFISALFRAAQAPDAETRELACRTLVRTGPAGGKWLATALTAPDAPTRAGAARVLSRMLPPPGEAAAAALGALKDAEASVRYAAAEALGAYALGHWKALPPQASEEVAEAMKGKDAGLRAALIAPLGRLAARHRKALDALISALDDDSAGVRKAAAAALGAMGPSARRAIPALRGALRARDCALRVLAGKALIAIDAAFSRNAAAAKAARAACPGVRAAPRAAPAAGRELAPGTTSQALKTDFSPGVSNTYHLLLPVTLPPGSTAQTPGPSSQ